MAENLLTLKQAAALTQNCERTIRRRIAARVEIRDRHRVVVALRDLQARKQHRVVEGGRHLANAAADAIHHLAILELVCEFPSIRRGSRSHRFVVRKRFAGSEQQAVYFRSRKSNVRFSIPGRGAVIRVV